MEPTKNTLLSDIIDILSVNNGQQENLENLICDVESKFVERGRSTKNLLNKIEDSIKIGTDLGLIAANEELNTVRLKFNPNKRPSYSIARVQDADDYYDDDDNDSDNYVYNEDFKADEYKVSDSETEYDDADDAADQQDEGDEYDENVSKTKVPSKSKPILSNSYPSTSKSQTLNMGHQTRHQVSDRPRKRKSCDDAQQRRTRRKY